MLELLTFAQSAPTLSGTVFTAVSAILLLLLLILVAKVHAFIALILASYYVGLMSGMDLLDINDSIKSGMGGILGFVATVVGLGAIFGKLLEDAGGAEALAYTMLKRFGEKRATWAMVITGFLVSIPVFLDVALVIIIPIVYALTRKTGKPILYYGIPLLAGLAVTHAFVPPTPGPILVAEQIGANLGLVILFGIIIGFPTAIIAGPIFGSIISKVITKGIPEEFQNEELEKKFDDQNLPSFTRVFLVILLPIVLILIQAITTELLRPPKTQVVFAPTVQVIEPPEQPTLFIKSAADGFAIDYFNYQGARQSLNTSDVTIDRSKAGLQNAANLVAFEKAVGKKTTAGTILPLKEQANVVSTALSLTGFKDEYPETPMAMKIIGFVGHPFTALIIAIFAATFLLARNQGFSYQQIMDLSNRALAPAGIIILVTGAGGVFKQILIDSQVADVLGQEIVKSDVNIVLLAFLVAALVRIAQGSATVAMVTAAAIIAPLLPEMPELSSIDYALITISIASGATTLSHVNDSGFWLVSKFFGLTEKETLMSWTVLETIISIMGLIGALTLSYLL